MDPGIFDEVIFVVQYTRPNRAEGGPVETRHFEDYSEALRVADRVKKDPEVTSVQVWRQHTTIERYRLH